MKKLTKILAFLIVYILIGRLLTTGFEKNNSLVQKYGDFCISITDKALSLPTDKPGNNREHIFEAKNVVGGKTTASLIWPVLIVVPAFLVLLFGSIYIVGATIKVIWNVIIVPLAEFLWSVIVILFR